MWLPNGYYFKKHISIGCRDVFFVHLLKTKAKAIIKANAMIITDINILHSSFSMFELYKHFVKKSICFQTFV